MLSDVVYQGEDPRPKTEPWGKPHEVGSALFSTHSAIKKLFISLQFEVYWLGMMKR